MRTFSLGTFVFKLHLNLHIDTGWQVERRQSVDRLCIRVEDVHDTLVDSHFELFTSVLVDEGGTVNRPLLLLGWKRHRTDNFCAGALGCLNDRTRGLIDDLVVVRTNLDSDSVAAGGFLGSGRLGFGVGHVESERTMAFLLSADRPMIRADRRRGGNPLSVKFI